MWFGSKSIAAGLLCYRYCAVLLADAAYRLYHDLTGCLQASDRTQTEPAQIRTASQPELKLCKAVNAADHTQRTLEDITACRHF